MEELTGGAEIRLQKALADAGVAARRKAETLIAAGRVTVNGAIVTAPGTKVDLSTDKVYVDGKPLPVPTRRYYFALNKPEGVVSTVRDRFAKQTVIQLVSVPKGVRLVPVGRLDADSEGLILLSDDGAFVQAVTHPSKTLGKTYIVTVKGTPSPDAIKGLERGLLLDGETRKTAPARVRLMPREKWNEKGTRVLEIVLHEGRNRQIRRMLDTVGHPVLRLLRIRVGCVELGDLAVGASRELTEAEVRGMMGGAPEPAKGEESKHEARHRGGSRPRPRKDRGEPAPKRIQVHENRIDGRIPPGGQRHIADWMRRQGRGKSPGPDQRSE